jgi:glucose-1-phosphate cytidylyltransferase
LVTQFNEKPQASGGWISGGFFVCNQDIFEYLDDRDDLTLEQEPMREIVRDGEMMIYQHDGYWQPMDTFRDFTLLNRLYEEKRAPWVIW